MQLQQFDCLSVARTPACEKGKVFSGTRLVHCDDCCKFALKKKREATEMLSLRLHGCEQTEETEAAQEWPRRLPQLLLTRY